MGSGSIACRFLAPGGGAVGSRAKADGSGRPESLVAKPFVRCAGKLLDRFRRKRRSLRRLLRRRLSDIYSASYSSGEADGDAEGEALVLPSVASDFFPFLPELDFAARPEPPILNVLASMLPSSCFQYDPVTFSFAAMSANVAAAPALVTVVLSVTLKTREVDLPATVNVCALVSTDATDPRNRIARGAFVSGEAAAVLSAGEALGEGDASFSGAADAVRGPERASAATQALVMRVNFFIRIGG